MDNDAIEAKVWYLSVTNYEEYECHRLSMQELKELIADEWDRRFNGLFIGRDVDCVGRLGVFFYDDMAYVAYEDFEREEWHCSYDLAACDRPDWDELIRLTPDDTHEFSFRRCSIIGKKHAFQIIETYLSSGRVEGLYFSGSDGKPVIGN
jgi:hypothetical protein